MLLGVARRVRRLGDGAAIQMQILDVTCIAPLAPTGKKLESRGAGRKHGVHALPAVHYRSFQVQPPFLGGLARVRVHWRRGRRRDSLRGWKVRDETIPQRDAGCVQAVRMETAKKWCNGAGPCRSSASPAIHTCAAKWWGD